jgi:hypothetical protein
MSAGAELAQPITDPTRLLGPAPDLQEPFHGTRGLVPGPMGCWAVKKDGQPCRAAVIRGRDFCSAHSGLGISENPKAFSPSGIAASAEKRRKRAELRLVLGITRPSSARSTLRALVGLNAERLAGRAVDAALDPSLSPRERVDLSLRLIEAAEPKQQITASIEGSIDPSTASFSELLSFAEGRGWAVPDGQSSTED